MNMTEQSTKTIEERDGVNNKTKYKIELVYFPIIYMALLHTGAVYGVVLAVTEAKYSTLMFAKLIVFLSGIIGIICAVHRFWSHRSFKAKLPLQIFLAICQTMALQKSIYVWSRDHRVHHKYSETDADPHNVNRGFFFAHIGWLFCKKHPDVIEKGKTILVDDLKKDPVVQFQYKYYPLMAALFGVFLPTVIPYYLWGESLWNSFFVSVIFPYVWVVNMVFCVNSAAHMWGMKPYDKKIAPVECYLRHMMGGEGFHNFHHVFPWDYAGSQYGKKDVFALATACIDLWAKLGLAFDLKKVPEQTVKKQMIKSGDPDHKIGSPVKDWVFGTFVYISPLTLVILMKLIYGFYTANLRMVN